VPVIWAGVRECLTLRQMQLSIVVQTLIFGALFGTISSIQQVFDMTYGRGEHFHYWFAFIALLAAPAAPINGKLVIRLGMRPLIRRSLLVQGSLSVLAFLVIWGLEFGAAEFWVYLPWSVTVFALAGFAIGNLNALALEPLGHIAGLAASLMGALATVGGAVIGALVGQLFDGTPVPLIAATVVLSCTGYLIMRHMPREQL